jgi:ATP-dependent DNA helicase RecG
MEVPMTAARESQHLDWKSLRKVTGATADFSELAQDCVCFANGAGGTLLIGIEDDADAPPASQRVDPALLDRIRKRVGELTVNVQVVPELKQHENGPMACSARSCPPTTNSSFESCS